MAVGTVVMNRLDSGKWGNTICGVVGQKGQFAPGVLSRPMKSAALPDVQAAADAVLKGERNPKVKNAMFFHTAGLRFPYKNMHYTVVAGGNAFYEKRDRYHTAEIASKDASVAIANAYIASTRMAGARAANTVLTASAAQPVSTTSSTPTSGRVTNQPIAVAQADIAPMAFDTKKVAVPVDRRLRQWTIGHRRRLSRCRRQQSPACSLMKRPMERRSTRSAKCYWRRIGPTPSEKILSASRVTDRQGTR